MQHSSASAARRAVALALATAPVGANPGDVIIALQSTAQQVFPLSVGLSAIYSAKQSKEAIVWV